MLSFWERESLMHADIIVIGAGIAGLSTALSIKELKPHKSVMVLERGILPYGASTRNAGFTTFGGVGELLHDLSIMPEKAVIELVSKRWEGLHLLRERLGDKNIGYENHGGYELVFRNEVIGETELTRINDLLLPIFKTQTFEMDHQSAGQFGFNPNFLSHNVYTRFEGQIHSGKMMKSLYQKAISTGINILTGAMVEHLEKHGSGIEVIVMNQITNEQIKFKTEQCVLCTNAFTGRFFPEMDITPGRGQVLVTTPIPNLPFKGIFHFDEGYYYFRNIDNRILFGGGRNLDFEGEKTTDIELNDSIQQKLDYYLKHLIIPGIKYKVDMRWSGIMAFGKEKSPIVKKVSDGIYAGVRMNGMGVALATQVGRELAQLVVFN